jgi:hypothetical protein
MISFNSWGDKRSPALKQQHKLFSSLGTLARTKANVRELISHEMLTPEQKTMLAHALGVITVLELKTRDAMRKLPSKKNAKAAEKEAEKFRDPLNSWPDQ